MGRINVTIIRQDKTRAMILKINRNRQSNEKQDMRIAEFHRSIICTDSNPLKLHFISAVLGKRMKIWERRLMKDFHVAPVAGVEDGQPPPDEDGLAKFRRIARMAVANTTSAKWDITLAGAGVS